MVDVTCLVIPLTLAPIVFALVATIIFLRYPDKHGSIILFTVAFTSLLSLFDLLTDKFILINVDSLRYLFSSIAQGYAAMIGILGAFLIFYIETIKNRVVGIRKEIIRRIPEPDFSKMFAEDDEFIDYLRGWSEGHKRLEGPYAAVQYSIVMLGSLVKEEHKIKMIISNQFIFLFVSIFLSFFFLLIMDSFNIDSPDIMYLKLIVYLIFSFSIASLISAIYGVYRIIYPDKAV